MPTIWLAIRQALRAIVQALADSKVAVAENTALTQQIQTQTNGFREEQAALLAAAMAEIKDLKQQIFTLVAVQATAPNASPPTGPQARGA